MNKNILQLTYSGLMAAMAFVSTSILAFPIAFTNGYIHLGDGIVLSCGVVLGKRNGALAAGIGSALADIYLGYAAWALPTFIIKALMAYIVGYVFEDLRDGKRITRVALVFNGLWIAFMAYVGSIIGNSPRVTGAAEGLMADGLIANAGELGERTSFTATALIIGILLIPALTGIMLLLQRRVASWRSFLTQFMTFMIAGTVMIVLYYGTYGILYGNWTVPVFSIPSNMLQYLAGIAIATVLLPFTLSVQRQLAE